MTLPAGPSVPRKPGPEGAPEGFRPLLEGDDLDRLRTALQVLTVSALDASLGPVGRAALDRGDLAGARRALPPGERTATLARLFLLGLAVEETDAAHALHPLSLDAAAAAGLVQRSAGSVRALLDVRPYGEADDGTPWWVVSDFGSDVRPGPVAADHVLGIGAAALTLAQATVRPEVARALDVGTGCGVQALHLGRHCAAVTATDISPRALRLAATAAALSGVSWDLREGSLLDPVAGERFDLVVANPPFVVSPGLRAGEGGYDYRDSGLAGDDVSRLLVQGLPRVLAPGGVAQLLANWIVPRDGTWQERLEHWLAGSECDAWVWQREVADVGEYVALWLRDAGEVPGSPRWTARYDEWADWFDSAGVAAVGMGLVTLWRTDGDPVVVCEDVPQAVEQPAGPHVAAWVGRRRRLAALTDTALADTPLRPCADLVLTGHALLHGEGWQTRLRTLRQSHGMRWEVETDEAVAALVAGLEGGVPLRVPVGVLAASLGVPADEVVEAVLPVVRDLVGRGVLEFAGARPAPASAQGSSR